MTDLCDQFGDRCFCRNLQGSERSGVAAGSRRLHHKQIGTGVDGKERLCLRSHSEDDK